MNLDFILDRATKIWYTGRVKKIALKNRIGELVEIEFEDHAWGDEIKVIKCKVYGELFKVTANRVVLRCWETMNFKDNDEFAVIVRSTIVPGGVRQLRKVGS